LPASTSDSASFFTRLRHSSLSSAALAAQAAFLAVELESLVQIVQSGSRASWSRANFMRSRLRCWIARENRVRRLELAGAQHVVEAQATALELRRYRWRGNSRAGRPVKSR
jgi:hypothetical protein